MEPDYIPIQGYNTLTARLLAIKEFRTQYRLLLTEVLEKWFTRTYIEPLIREWHATLRPYILLDPYKQSYIDLFDAEPAYILRYVEERNQYLRNHLGEL